MQRGQVVVASAYTPPSNQFDETERGQLAEMHEHWTPPPRAGVRPPSPPPDDQDRQHQHRHPMSLPGGASRRNYNYNNKPKKPKPLQHSSNPCIKFVSGYGCSYGDKCRFSHDPRALYPAYYEYGPTRYDDPVWSADFVTPRQVHQNNLPRQTQLPLNPPPMPKSDPVRHSSTFHQLPPRERASSFANHSKLHNKPDETEMLSSGKPLFKEAVLMKSKVKSSESEHHKPASQKSTESDGYGDENRHTNREVLTQENKCAESMLPRQQQRRKNAMRARKCASGEVMANPASGDSAEFCHNPNYLLNEVGEVDLKRAAGYAKLQPQHQEQQYFSRPELLQSVYNPYAQYVAEEQLHSNLGRQVEAFVNFVDTKLASMEMHQQQAIDSLQELVRSLWPDAIIDIYGSNYTRLALPASDVDCVLVARSLVGERPLTILEALAAEVERQPWTKQLELLGSAKIPVLKMAYSLNPTQQDVLLDLTCGHSVGHTGLDARELIYSFQAEMPALRPLVLILKSHLVKNDLNSAFTGGISSFVLVILVIRFLQACGGTHLKSFTNTSFHKMRGNRHRSYSENPSARDFPEGFPYQLSASETISQPKWCYTFSRGGRVTWRTGISSLLMLFLETYITFDYRRFGISIYHEGEFFLLPPDKVVSTQSSVVIPYVADPIKPGRSICNCFRMHEVIQSWVALYQNLAARIPVATCVGGGSNP